jgi:hypothetical protein
MNIIFFFFFWFWLLTFFFLIFVVYSAMIFLPIGAPLALSRWFRQTKKPVKSSLARVNGLPDSPWQSICREWTKQIYSIGWMDTIPNECTTYFLNVSKYMVLLARTTLVTMKSKNLFDSSSKKEHDIETYSPCISGAPTHRGGEGVFIRSNETTSNRMLRCFWRI